VTCAKLAAKLVIVKTVDIGRDRTEFPSHWVNNFGRVESGLVGSRVKSLDLIPSLVTSSTISLSESYEESTQKQLRGLS